MISLTVVGLTGIGLSKPELSAGYRELFEANDPKIIAMDQLESEFSKVNNTLFLIQPDNGNGFSNETLSIVKELTNVAWKMSFSTRVDSLTNFQHTVADGDDLVVGDLVEEPMSLTETQLEYIKQVALNEPALRGKLVSETGDVDRVHVIFQIPDLERNKDAPEVIITPEAKALEKAF